MAHQISHDAEGAKFLYTGETPWHKLGRVMTDEERHNAVLAMTNARLLDEVKTLPVYDARGKVIPRYAAVTRTRDGNVYQISSDRYTVIGAQALADCAQPIMDSTGMWIDVATSLRDGAVTFLSLTRGKTFSVGKDPSPVQFYMLLVDSVDGSHTGKLALTCSRAVCANTLSPALSDAEITLKVRHTRRAPAKFEATGEALAAVGETLKASKAFMEAMATAPFSDGDMGDLAAHLYPPDDGELSTQAKTARERLMDLFPNGLGHEPIRGTAWAGYNAVAQYTDHEMTVRGGAKEDARAYSVLFGSAARLKIKAEGFIRQRVSLAA
jgi:phage/plasmid-like protein (TIGR03299 family)